MDYKINRENATCLVDLNGSLSNDLIDDIKIVLIKEVNESKKGLIVSLENVSFLCSAAFGMFFALHTLAQKSGKKICFCCVKQEIEKLFAITGVHRHMNIAKTRDEALSFMKSY